MSESLAQFLTDQQADATTVQHAVRYLVAELSGDLSRQEMRETVAEDVGEAHADDALEALGSNSAVLLDADLAVLAALWEDDEQRERVRGAIIDAKDKLPVVETAIIVTAAMYGLYLVTTGGKKRSIRKVRRQPDGSWEESEEIDFHDPTGPLQAVGNMLRRLLP
jgi:hypothetical protein